jgi:hypothetical protein
LQQLPWNGDIRDRTFEGFASISSKNGGVITIESPSHLEPSATIRHLADQAPAPRLKTLSTNYALLAAATEVKPDQVKWWKTRGQNAKCDESSVVSGPQMSSFSTSNSFSAPGRTSENSPHTCIEFRKCVADPPSPCFQILWVNRAVLAPHHSRLDHSGCIVAISAVIG